MRAAAWLALALLPAALAAAAAHAAAGPGPGGPQPAVATDPAYGQVENVSVRTTAHAATVRWDVALPCGPDVLSRLSYWPAGEEGRAQAVERVGGGGHRAVLEGLDPGTEYAYTIDLAADCGVGGGSSGELRFVTAANPVWVPALLSGGALLLLGVAAWETRRRL